MTKQGFYLNGWYVDVAGGRITQNEQTRHLEPKIMKTLAYLASRHNEVVTKDQLVEAVWSRSYVSDAALTRCIFELRQVFGDDARKPTVIETIPKVGYRLLVSPQLTRKRRKAGSHSLRWSAAAAIPLLALLASSMQATPIDARTIEVVEQFSEVPLANNAYNKGLEHYERGLYLANVNAIALFEKAIEYDPSFGMAYIRLSESLAQESNRWGGGRLDEALDAATTAVSLEPTNARSHNALGIAQLLGNDTDSALESFQRSNELDPTYWDSTYNAAYTHMARFEHAESIELFLRVLEYSPEHFEAMSRLGFQYLRMGNTDDARYWLDRTLVHAPQSMLAWTGLAMLELVTRNTSKTIENCEHVIRVMPNNETCLHVTAVAHLIEGNTEEAYRIFDYVIENIERTDYAELGQAQILLSKGNTDEGVKVVNKVLERTLLKLPESEGQWRESRIIAACYTLLGDKTSAVSWLEKSSESGRRFPLWDATDPMFANLHGDHRFNRFIALAKNAD